MLHVVTVHYRSARWIDIQARHLREHIEVPYQTWTSLERVEPGYVDRFDHVFEQRGSHAGKMNNLAMEVSQVADPEDLLMFLDGDAFPIADPMPLIHAGLSQAPLLAVRRAENVDEPQPHPCFCVTSVGAWRRLPGDWTAGPTWPGAHGQPTSDVGANLMRNLELAEVPWVQVLRSNRVNLDPLYFAIYGEAIYHHGAGFRTGELSPVHRQQAPAPLPSLGPLRAVMKMLNGIRWRRWEASMRSGHVRDSERVYEQIRSGGREWLAQFG